MVSRTQVCWSQNAQLSAKRYHRWVPGLSQNWWLLNASRRSAPSWVGTNLASGKNAPPSNAINALARGRRKRNLSTASRGLRSTVRLLGLMTPCTKVTSMPSITTLSNSIKRKKWLKIISICWMTWNTGLLHSKPAQTRPAKKSTSNATTLGLPSKT